MRKIALGLILALSLACASAPKTEFQTVSTAVAGVEAARGAYYNLRVQCTANPQIMPQCPQIVAAHDRLQAAYVTYQKCVVLLSDANIAAINLGIDPTQSADVAKATAALMQAAMDFVTLKNDITGVK